MQVCVALCTWSHVTCMHCTLPPLFATEVMSLLAFLVTGKAAVDLRPMNGATMLACAGEVRLTVFTAGEEIMEAISFFLLSSLTHNFCCQIC